MSDKTASGGPNKTAQIWRDVHKEAKIAAIRAELPLETFLNLVIRDGLDRYEKGQLELGEAVTG
jgi:hypothetical protein